MVIEHYEGVENKGWWWYTQLLIGEAKSQQSSKKYKVYCDTFIEFLEAYGPPPQRERKWGNYGPR